MRRLRSTQTQLILFTIVVIVLLTIALLAVQINHERDTLEEATYQQGQISALALKESARATQSILLSIQQIPGVAQTMQDEEIMLLMLRLADENLTQFVAENPRVSFAALTTPDGTIFVHTDPTMRGSTAEALGLTDIPFDRAVRRSIPGYDGVYLTRIRFNVAEPFAPVQYDAIIGTPAGPVDDALSSSIRNAVAVAFLALLVAVALAYYLIRHGLTRPLATLRENMHAFGAGELDRRVKPGGNIEVSALGRTFNAMSDQLEADRNAIEALYEEAAASLREHVRDIEMAAQIGRVAAGLRDVDRLLNETVQQIRQRFESIYHAQVFLVDDTRQHAVLIESTGDAGRQLLALNHKLAVGSNSVIGRVTAHGEIVIASDTRAGDVPWQPNPILPDTRAEMALPLKIENRVIGALDVQSTQPDVFTGNMMRTFTVLADLIAIAVANAQLHEETARRLRQIDTLNQQLTQTTWQQFLLEDRIDRPQGYLYNQLRTAPLDDDLPLGPSADMLEVPIRVHNEAIGSLITEIPAQHHITADERRLVEAVADRVALAIENARLFEQTQRALSETERLYETARTVSSASELEAIYELVVEQLSTSLHVDQIEVLLSGPDPVLVQYLENAYFWNRSQPDAVPLVSERLYVPPLTFTDEDLLPVNAPVIHHNLRADQITDHPLYARIAGQRLHSVVLAPITAGGRWFGLLLCGAGHPNAFDAAYVSFAGALADQLALAIENRRLFEEAQTEARRARALAEAGQLASQIGGDYETGLDNLFQAVSGPGNYDRWWFGLMNDAFTHLEQIVTRGISAVDVVDVQKDENALAEAARISQIVLINDPSDFPLATEPDRDQTAEWGKHIAMPVRIRDEVVGVLLIGRGLDEPNLDERDIQLAATLASQIAVATQNQTLFTEAESQRLRLQTIVDTMPTGILVMDRQGRVILSNQNLLSLLGPDMRPNMPERPRPYPILHADTQEVYPRKEWPLSRVFDTEKPATADDMVIVQPNGSMIHVLAQAAPIIDQHGQVTAVVGAFQDITDLQELERALQDSLRETTMLYEASRSISRATSMEGLLQATIWHMSTIQPAQAYIFLAGEQRHARAHAILAATHPHDLDTEITAEDFDSLFEDAAVLVGRDDADPAIAACLDRLGLTRIGSFPLSVRGQISGWMVVGFESGQTITTEQRRFMTTLADQAAVTIENQRLLARTAEALEETALLYHASRAMSDSESPADVLDAFVRQATTRTTSHARLYVLLSESASVSYAAVELVAVYGDHREADPVGTRYRVDEFPFWEEIHSNAITHIEDSRQAPGLNDHAHALFSSLQLHGAMIVPLQAGERVIGGIMIGLDDPWADAANEIRVYEALADQAAVALENTRLYQQTQRRARQLATSAQISRAVTSILHLEDLLPQVVNQIREGFGYDHAQVFLLNADGTRANLVASTGAIGEQLLALGHYLSVGSRSVIGQVTALGEPQIALDTADARVVHQPNPLLPDTRSEMALPLIARGQILGALDVQSNQSAAFTDEDISVLAALADMVATAIDNARLFEIAEERAEEMTFLFNVTTAATASTDLEESLEQVVQTLRDTMQATGASIYLPSATGDEMVKGADAGDTGLETATTTVTMDRGLVGWVARKLEPVIINDLSQDPRRLSGNEDARSAMAVPLITGRELTGVLTVESDRTEAFNEEDLRLLQTLSTSLAAIVQNSRLLREMQVVNEQLLEVDRLKTNFLAAMSHELRTPLNSIIGFSRVILKGIDGPLTETQEQDLNTIYESGKHLLGLVNDILDQAKIEAGKMELAFGYFKLQDVIKGVMSSAVGLTRENNLQLITNIEGELPDAYGDEFRTRQVLLNLVSNAAKFTEEGSITMTALPVERNGYQYIQVSVTDTGIGIAQKDMHKLFEAFQQVDNSLTRKVGGTGMGLPLAKSLTELQHGQLWVESEVGVGSTFSITVPAEPIPDDKTGELPELNEDAGTNTGPQAKPAASDGDRSSQRPQIQVANPATETEPVPEAAQAAANLPAEPPLPTKTALVIEDNEGVISFYKRYLQPEGYEVIGVTDPTSVRFTLAVRPNIVLLDVNMKNGAGWRVLEELNEIAHVPVIVCSINEDRERGLALGAADYIFKPFAEHQLVDAVRRAESQNKTPCILLVDDRPESVRPFRDALLDAHYTVLDASSGEEALEIIDQEAGTIDLVILDLRMPGIDGFDVLQTLRTNDYTVHIPVLVLTAGDLNPSERDALQSIDVYRKDAMNEQHLLDRVEARLDFNRENK